MSDAKRREQELRKIVLAWLTKKRYQGAVAAFQKEAGIRAADPLPALAFKLPKTEDELDIKSYILQWGMEDAKPSKYEESYTELREWVLLLLDDLKQQLVDILYPIFLHTFLELASKQYVAEATAFLQKYRHEHQPEWVDELDVAARIMDAAHLETNAFARKYLGRKAKVTLTAEADALLTDFLHSRGLHVIVKLVNQHLTINIASPSDPPPGLPPVLPISEQDEARGRRRRLRWAELAEDAVKRRCRARGEGGGGAGGGGGEKRGTACGELAAEAEEGVMRDVERRATLSEGSLPSACCFTMFNAREALVAMDVGQDGRVMAAGFADARVKVWESAEWAEVDAGGPAAGGAAAGGGAAGGGGGGGAGRRHQESLYGHKGAVYGTAVSPDSRWVVTCSEDGTARLWGAQGRSNLVTYRGQSPFPMWDCAFAPLGHYFATVSLDRTACLYATDHVYALRVMAGHLASVDCCAFHPTSNFLTTGSADRSCRLWDLGSGECVRLFKGHRAALTAVAVSNCGKMIAGGADNGDLLVWDVNSSKLLASLAGHEGGVYSLDFSKGGGDSAMLASAGQDGTVRLWDVRSAAGGGEGEGELKVLHTRQTRVLRVRFTHSNLLLAAGAFNPPT